MTVSVSHVYTTLERCRCGSTRQDQARRDVGVLQQLQRHKAVVVAGLLIFQDLGQLLQVTWTQQMRNVLQCRRCQKRKSLWLDLEDLATYHANQSTNHQAVDDVSKLVVGCRGTHRAL
jgi:uncharacterized metal-binding protein YceD (DUF177 family)